MCVHDVITLAALIVVVIIPVVVTASVETTIEITVVSILVGKTQCQPVAHCMTQRSTELPRSIELILINLAAGEIFVKTYVCTVDQLRIVGRLQIVPCRRVYIQTDTERRSLNGTEDDTCLDIKTSSFDTTLISQRGGTDTSVIVIQQLLGVFAISLVVYILET